MDGALWNSDVDMSAGSLMAFDCNYNGERFFHEYWKRSCKANPDFFQG
jgi:hypothetical protein